MAMHDTETFGRALRAAREKAGVSQGALARHLGISGTYVSDIERGYRAPLTPERLASAASFLGADAVVLLEARATWHGCTELPVMGDAKRDRLAAQLADEWRRLSDEQVDAIAAQLP